MLFHSAPSRQPDPAPSGMARHHAVVLAITTLLAGLVAGAAIGLAISRCATQPHPEPPAHQPAIPAPGSPLRVTS